MTVKGTEPAGSASEAPILSVRGVRKHFPVAGGGLFGKKAVVQAIDRLDFDVMRGETLSLVGESGCGKSTTARLVMRLIEPSSGTVRFDGSDLMDLSAREMRARRRDMQIVFQDPFGSLDPRMTVGQLISEPLFVHGIGTRETRRQRVAELLTQVGLPPAVAGRHPHEFSGGQRQRVVIARALALKPKLIVCDEPVSALDVSVQAQVVNLLQDLQETLGLTYLFISHDLSIVRHISTRVAVMYLGRIIELSDRDTLYTNPLHPYTQILLSAVPTTESGSKRRYIPKGEIPSPMSPPTGCHFHPRCPFAQDRCRKEVPDLRAVGPGTQVACHLVQEAGEGHPPKAPSIAELLERSAA